MYMSPADLPQNSWQDYQAPADDPLHPGSGLPMQDTGCESHCWSTKMAWIYKQGGYWTGLTCDLSACSWDTENRQWICLYTRNCVTQRGNKV